MKIIFSDKAKHKLVELKKKDAQLVEKVYKQLDLFIKDSKHPSLRTHKLSGKLENSWSISIDRKFRFAYTWTKEGNAYFYKLGTHDEVYRK